MPRGCCLLAVAAQLVWVEPEEAEGPVSVETLGTETPPVSQPVTEPVSHHLNHPLIHPFALQAKPQFHQAEL